MTAEGYAEIQEQIKSDTFIVSEKLWGFLKKKENVVVDTSVIIKWFFSENEENAEASHLILKSFLCNKIGLITPEIAQFELANVVKNKISTEGSEIIGMNIIDKIYNLGIIFKVTKQVLKNAFSMALAINESVYDCIFIATAEHFDSKFITDDKKLYLSYEDNKKNIKSHNLIGIKKTIDAVLLKDYI
ncbi:MAG: type II toxin-antitoxin system VapC family toxin [Actinobacteria bacterium]|nr:type II toxin-antitoxin system VapC family toxin [Actinomycetota bacterium]